VNPINDVTYWTAFVAGLLSFFSPCVLPLVPAYLANLAGESAIDIGGSRRVWPTLLHSVSFVLGFSILFILMGASAGLIGASIIAYSDTLRIISGIVVIIFGVFLIAAHKIPWLNYEKRLHMQGGRNPGYIRSMMIGAAFAVGWTPCIGPILGSILFIASYTGETAKGAALLAVYSLGGRTIPDHRPGLELYRTFLERHHAPPWPHFYFKRHTAYNSWYIDADQPADLAEPVCNLNAF